MRLFGITELPVILDVDAARLRFGHRLSEQVVDDSVIILLLLIRYLHESGDYGLPVYAVECAERVGFA